MKKRRERNQPLRRTEKVPFIEHIYELRRRLFYIVASIGVFSAIAYAFEHYIIAALLKPAREQEFIYTSPGGGIDFLFRVCIYTGIACSIPVIVYQILKYIEPLIQYTTRRMMLWGGLVSGFLAIVGVLFGYFIGLPSGLDFLLHQFKTDQIQPLITIHSYMNFVALYLLGSAMLLQVPLVLLFINRIKPLSPKKLFGLGAQRWVILGAFVGSAIINASPQVMAQLVVAGPIILSYEIGVAVIWYVNRRQVAPGTLQELRERDAALIQARLEAARQARPLLSTHTDNQETTAARVSSKRHTLSPASRSLQNTAKAGLLSTPVRNTAKSTSAKAMSSGTQVTRRKKHTPFSLPKLTHALQHDLEFITMPHVRSEPVSSPATATTPPPAQRTRQYDIAPMPRTQYGFVPAQRLVQ